MRERLFRLVYPHRGRTRGLGRVESWLFLRSRAYGRYYDLRRATYWQDTYAALGRWPMLEERMPEPGTEHAAAYYARGRRIATSWHAFSPETGTTSGYVDHEGRERS